jgi:hypothetical protein
MFWRKWLVRGLVLTIAAGLAGAGWLFQRWTSPAVVRQQVISRLQALFPRAAIALESARLRLLGGIALSELRLARRDDPTRTDFVYVPSARIYHDKEQLLDGKLALRKVELYRPRFRVVREKDGHWNWADLVAKSDSHEPLPTLVIDDGTLLLEDRQTASGLPPLEILHVQLTVLNDPVSTVTVTGEGRSEMLGKVELHATLQRETGQGSLAVKALGIPVTSSLISQLASGCPQADIAHLTVSGIADFEGELHYSPGIPKPWKYDLACKVHDGKIDHPRLPLALQDMELSLRCADGTVTVKTFTASSGPALVSGEGQAQLGESAADVTGTVRVQHLPLTRELCKRLPWDMTRIYDMLSASGPVSVCLEFDYKGGNWHKRHCLLRPEGAAICYDRFRYPVEQITGTLDLDLVERLLKMDLAGYASGQPVYLQGYWKSTGLAADVQMDIQADGVALDEKLIHALPTEALQQLARSFHPKGKADLVAHIRHVPGAEKYDCTYQARFHDAFVKWDGFPYPVDKVNGTLILLPDHWEFRDFAGTRNGADIRVRGTSFPQEPGVPPGRESRVVIDIAGKNVGIDADLREALRPLPGLAKGWDTFRPGGRMSFQARVDRVPGKPQDMDIAVEVNGCSVLPIFFPYALQDLSGQFRFKGSRLQFSQVRANHGASTLTIDQGTVDFSPRGAYYAVLEDVWANPVVPEQDFIAALPKMMGAGVTFLKLEDPLKIWARKVIVAQDDTPGSRPDLWWEGQLRLDRTRLNLGIQASDVTGTVACVGRYDGQQLRGLVGNAALTQATVLKQPLENVHAHFHVKDKTPSIVVIDLNKAPLFGGDLSGQARLEFGSTMRYDVNLTASQIDMHQLGRHNLGPKSDLAGRAWARLFLTGQGEGISTLEGNGSFHLPRGKLYKLPFVSELVRFLDIRGPERTFFDEAHADFSIHGQRLLVDRLDFWGRGVNLSGKGALNLDGTDAALDFYSSWGPLEPLLPPALRTVTPALSKCLLKIEMRGKVGGRPEELKFHKKPVPVLLDPLLEIRDRVVKGEKK